ncbi:MAG: GNAT family N-acetyltransferase [Bacteroidetes bacterium]|nr:GNAT family N-acetyltransferase [Bacteroidota bacterium]
MLNSKIYKIETERLTIRCYKPMDASMLLEATSLSINHLLPWMPWANEEQNTLNDKINLIRQFRGKFDLDIDYIYGIFDKSQQNLIGGTGLHKRIGNDAREIGYWINVRYINNGFATEAVSALIKAGFEIENHSRIEIHCAPENIQSQNIPRKLGFTLEAILKQRTKDADGNLRDSMIWTLFKDDYMLSNLKKIDLKAYNFVDEEIIF